MSLRRRVLLGSLAVALILLAADAALVSTFRGYLLGRVDAQLEASAEQLVRLAADPERPGRRGAGPGGPGPRAFSEFYVAVADAGEGEVTAELAAPLRQGRDEPEPTGGQVLEHASAPGEAPEPFTVGSVDDEGWRMIALQPDELGEEIVLVGASLEGVGATYERMLAVLAVATAVVFATLAVSAWWVLRQGVRPLAAMTATAEAIADGNWQERIDETDERTEAGRLGAALNAMLARIESAFADRAASQERLRRFVADASHELRTPLTSIRGYSELYRTGGLEDPERLGDAMRRIEGEATRMGALVDDLLLLARLDQGRPIERGRVDLGGLVGDVVADHRAINPGRPVELRTEPVTVTGDDARLRQAVGNLLANLRAHTPVGTPATVTVARDGPTAVVTVADAGPGMPAEVAERAFERFYRADASRTRQAPGDGAGRGQGAGLGLAIVASVAEAHGGEVAVDATVGEGTTVQLSLPCEDASVS